MFLQFRLGTPEKFQFYAETLLPQELIDTVWKIHGVLVINALTLCW